MTVFVLKIIAVLSMLIDHSAAVFLQGNPDYAMVYLYARSIGRIAFPIFAFLIAQGCLHTRSIYKYALRLGILAIVSEPFFDLALVGKIDFFARTNIFYTLFLAVCAIALYKILVQLKREVLAFFLAGIPFAMIAELLPVDYVAIVVVLILLLFVANPTIKLRACAIIAAAMVFLYFGQHHTILAFSLISIVLIYFYNGKLGANHPIIKYGFYGFYPLHLLTLYMIS